MGIIKTIGLATITAIIATNAVAQELKLADFQPPTHFIVDTTYTPFGEAISAATGGETTVKVFMGGELGAGPAEQNNRVVDGVADIAFGLPGYTASNFPLTLISELPGVLTAKGGTQAMMDNVDMLSDEYRRVQLVGLWNNAPNLILTAEKPVRSMDDLVGMNIRVPSRNAGIVVQAWGANPVSMPAPEIYNAMQTGVIDGAMIDPTTLKSFKLAEVTNFVTQGMDTTISEFFLIMNRDVFADLDDTAQQAVLDAGREAALTAGSTWLKIADDAMADFAAAEGKEVITLSEDEAAKFNAASAAAVEQIVTDAEAEGIPAKAWIDALAAD
ncbi:TRAP transporter substrate-binding protein [Maritimibacter sp. UBA3975]|uniref:TRAP transporter substrate-binding protein n=1 Tax=Maritimibacter sp. UBA3975 TaxID=1946833 RepID=UPI000C099F23|nr:TRAP transporter substrate-binding protein [Maritimibacter sp. UBA3975]MAM60087.1 ABC transporter substrate-binding protein [Maritimibacter sp.]|tara:strand:+ start:13630 stop:14616 length:987 start_codon:yes stop_codon:yes gene_type:complete